MVGFNKLLQIFLSVMVVVFSILLLVLHSMRLFKARTESKRKDGTPFTNRDFDLWLIELLVALGLVAMVSIVLIIYSVHLGFIPADSPTCLPYLSEFGVIASGVDASKFAVSPAASYPANSYAEAVNRFKQSPNGLATGYFSWDGLSVTILNSNAYQLRTGATSGTSWVFQDLSVTTGRRN